ncbi:MAG: hypothetical protein A2539_03750 [Elusimicrobia bacterium RIFOXYD2_FULL_34_15]|nr:MAG: hypothetical protein A2539_03750 [Elusimicrobia bacterium RIFOXYD2_FULL_34_15]
MKFSENNYLIKKFSNNIILIFLFVILIILVFYRDVVIDEGIYLYIGKLVAKGKLPYIDFLHPQGQMYALILGLMSRIFTQDLYINRIVVAICSFIGILLLGRVARNIGNTKTETIYYLFNLTSVYVLAHYVVVTTYAIAFLFLSLSIYFAIYKYKPILSCTLIIIASLIRLSIISIVPLFIFYFISKSSDKKKLLLRVLIITILIYSVFFIPFILKSYDTFIYDIITAHTNFVNLPTRILIMLDTLIVNLKDYSILLTCTLILSILFIIKKRIGYKKEIIFLFLIFFILMIVHLLPISNRGTHYNVLNIPVLFIIIGYFYNELFQIRKIGLYGLIFILILNFVEQAVLVKKSSLFQNENPVDKIKLAAMYVDEKTDKSDTILTFNTLLATQANRNIPIEFTNDCFSYKKGFDTAKCKIYHLVNDDIFLTYINDNKIKLLALGDFDLHQFGTDKKNILEAIRENGFIFTKQFENFGQWHDNLYVYTRK